MKQSKHNSAEYYLNSVTSQHEGPGWVKCSGPCVNIFVCSSTAAEPRDVKVKVSSNASCIQMGEYSHIQSIVNCSQSLLKVKRHQKIQFIIGL